MDHDRLVAAPPNMLGACFPHDCWRQRALHAAILPGDAHDAMGAVTAPGKLPHRLVTLTCTAMSFFMSS